MNGFSVFVSEIVGETVRSPTSVVSAQLYVTESTEIRFVMMTLRMRRTYYSEHGCGADTHCSISYLSATSIDKRLLNERRSQLDLMHSEQGDTWMLTTSSNRGYSVREAAGS